MSVITGTSDSSSIHALILSRLRFLPTFFQCVITQSFIIKLNPTINHPLEIVTYSLSMKTYHFGFKLHSAQNSTKWPLLTRNTVLILLEKVNSGVAESLVYGKMSSWCKQVCRTVYISRKTVGSINITTKTHTKDSQTLLILTFN